MIIKEVLSDYKAIYDILKKNDEIEQKETYFVNEIVKRENKNIKHIISIIEVIIPLLLFVMATIFMIVMHKSDIITKFLIGTIWLLCGTILGIVVLMLNVRIINRKIENKEKVIAIARKVILIETFVGGLIMICIHLSYIFIIK